MIAEADLRVGLSGLEKDAPAIVRHLHVIEMSPAFAANIDCRPQPNVFLLKAFRAHVVPPRQKVRQPLLERSLKALVFGKIYVVRNAFVKIHSLPVLCPWHFVLRSLLKRSLKRDGAIGEQSTKHKIQRSCSLEIKLRLRRLSIICQRAVRPNSVRPLKDPVLPSRQAPIDFRVHRFRSRKSK